MGDMGEIFNALREKRKAERNARADKAPEMIARLRDAGHDVRQLSADGPHLRVAERFDFWPSTGRWVGLKSRARGSGIKSLLRAL